MRTLRFAELKKILTREHNSNLVISSTTAIDTQIVNLNNPLTATNVFVVQDMMEMATIALKPKQTALKKIFVTSMPTAFTIPH